jgi:hypothetical protein
MIQVLHWLLTLLLHECEPVQLVILRYCSLQAGKRSNLCDVILRGVRANFDGFRCFGEALQMWRYCMCMGKPTACEKYRKFNIPWKYLTDVNIVLSEIVTDIGAVSIDKTNCDFGGFKLCLKYWVAGGTGTGGENKFCRPVLSYW